MNESKELAYLENIQDYTKDTAHSVESIDKYLGGISQACADILRTLKEIERKIK